MDALSVFQEQSMLLYVIAGLLIVLIAVGAGIWLRLGDIRDALAGTQKHTPKMMSWKDRPVVPREDPQPVGATARAYYGGKPPRDL